MNTRQLVMGGIVGAAAVLLLVFSLVGRGGMSATRDEPPLETLKRRYARGEIDQDTFDQMKESLMPPAE